MIPEVKIRGLDFIGTENEEFIWDYIGESQKDIKGEFIITFHGKTSDDVEKISTAVFKRKNLFRIRTNISLTKLAVNHVFMDITSDENFDKTSMFRFQIKADPPVNIIRGLTFIKDYSQNIKNKSFEIAPDKKQKRNDSSEFNYNKR